jgi:hypothetical protein
MGRASLASTGNLKNDLLALHRDLLLAVAGSSAQFQPEISVGSVLEADRYGKPPAMFLAPDAQAGLDQLSGGGVDGFRPPNRARGAPPQPSPDLALAVELQGLLPHAFGFGCEHVAALVALRPQLGLCTTQGVHPTRRRAVN